MQLNYRISIHFFLIIEIIDTEENINKILPFLDETVEGGPATLEKATVIKYSSSKK